MVCVGLNRPAVSSRADVAHTAAIITSSQQMLAFNRPTTQEYRSLRNYIEYEQPLHGNEQDYIQHKEDLVILRPGRDHAWLDRSIEHSLHVLHKPFPFLHVRSTMESTKFSDLADLSAGLVLF